jgi:hypothetical protein
VNAEVKIVRKGLAQTNPISEEGSLAGPFPPPLTPEKPFSVLGLRRIFLLFSKVVADGLLSAALVFDPKMVLSPRYSPKLLTKGVLAQFCKLL